MMYFPAGFSSLVWQTGWPSLRVSELCQIFPIDGITKYEGGYQYQHMCTETSGDFLVYPGLEVYFTALEDFDMLFECTPGSVTTEQCSDGSVITTQSCAGDYSWVPTTETCPSAPAPSPPSSWVPSDAEPQPPIALLLAVVVAVGILFFAFSKKKEPEGMIL